MIEGSGRHWGTLRAHVEGLRSWGLQRLPRVATQELKTAEGPGSLARDNDLGSSSEARSGTPVESAATPAPAGIETFTPLQKQTRLDAQAQTVSGCQKCRLAETRTQTVFGVGDPAARLMFVGEAPGADEDREGEPFVGRAGQLLNKMIAAMGLAREQVYIANILKCRPPANRDPLADETAACTPYLVEQILTVRPQAIVALGKPASNYLLNRSSSLTSLRGKRYDYHGIPLFVTYHPAALLRVPGYKAAAWEDLKRVMGFLELPLP